jgi:chloramphenicol-sensitive protein RarD
VNEERRGIAFGLAAYTMWGLFPLFFPLLKPATAVEQGLGKVDLSVM